MKFKVEYTENSEYRHVIVYRENEFSFDTVPRPETEFASILIDDLNLGVDESGRIISVWGVCPHTRWIPSRLVSPEARDGLVRVVTEQPLRPSVSVRINSGNAFLPTFVDATAGWVKVRCAAGTGLAVRILKGVTLVITERGEVCELWLRPAAEMRPQIFV